MNFHKNHTFKNATLLATMSGVKTINLDQGSYQIPHHQWYGKGRYTVPGTELVIGIAIG